MSIERHEEEAVTLERAVDSVYHSLGMPNADEMERKAKLVSLINDTLKAKGLTQLQAAEIVGIDQPTLAKLLRGQFRSITLERLEEVQNLLSLK